MQIQITLVQTIDIPDDAEIARGPTGAVIGVQLADGRIVRPWISHEIEEDGGEAYRDLSYDELQALDFDVEGDLERDIEVVEG